MTPIPNTVLARLLHRLAGAVCEHPGWFLYPQIGLALAGVLYTTQRLKLDMNREHLVGAICRQQRAYLQYGKEFPREDELVVVVQGGQRERNRQFIERLAARVCPRPISSPASSTKATWQRWDPRRYCWLPPKDLEDLQQALNRYRPVIQNLPRPTNLNSFFSLVSKQFRAAPSTGPAATQCLLQCLPFMQTPHPAGPAKACRARAYPLARSPGAPGRRHSGRDNPSTWPSMRGGSIC